MIVARRVCLCATFLVAVLGLGSLLAAWGSGSSLAGTALLAADPAWPMYGHDYAHTSRSTANGPTAPAVAWKYRVDAGHRVIGADGTIYLAGFDAFLAMNPDGTVKWSIPLGFAESIRMSPAIGPDGTIYAVKGVTDDYLVAMRPEDGRRLWSFRLGDTSYQSPTVGSDGTIYIANRLTVDFVDGKWVSGPPRMYALNPDGTVKWQQAIGSSNTCGIETTAAVGPNGDIYVQHNCEGLVALDANGQFKWARGGGQLGQPFNSPSVGPDGTIYIGSSDYTFRALNPDGSQKWEAPVENWMYSSSSAISADGSTIYRGDNGGILYAFSSTGIVKWKFDTGFPGGSIDSPPALAANGILYFTQSASTGLRPEDKGYLYAVRASDGKLLWKYEVGFSGIPPVLGADGTLYVQGWDAADQGWLYAITPGPTPALDLWLDKNHSGDFTVGSNGIYSLTVGNIGPVGSTGQITVTDTLPNGLSYLSGTGSDWSCSASGQTVACSNPGPLAAGQRSTLSLTVSVGIAAVPTVTNSACVATPGDSDPGNNCSGDRTTVKEPADTFPGTIVGALPVDFALDTTNFTTEPGESPESCDWTIGRTAWYTLALAVAADVTIATAGSSFNTIVAVYTGDAIDSLAPVPGACSVLPGTSPVSFRAAAGIAYHVQIGGWVGEAGDLRVAFTAKPEPAISLSPASLAFADQQVGTTSAARAVTLTNSGNAPLAIDNIAAEGDFAQTNNCPLGPATLAAGASCAISVTFTPTAAGSRAGMLTIMDNAPGSPHTVALGGTGTAPAGDDFPGITVGSLPAGFTAITSGFTTQPGEPTSVCGGRSVGRTAWYTVTPTSATDLTIATAGSGFDTIIAVYTGDSVGGLAPVPGACNDDVDGTRQSRVSFTAAAGTAYRVQIGGWAGGSGDLRVAFTVASRPAVGLSPPTLAFGNQPVGTISASQPVTLTNSGNAPLTIDRIAIDGDFAQTNACPLTPATLAAGASCAISVTFTPTALGSRSGALTITDNAPGSPRTVPIDGTGVDNPLPPFQLALSATPGGRASAAPPGPTYQPGTSVALTATATPGYAFAGWTVNGVAAGTANPFSLTMNQNYTVVASFVAVPLPSYSLTLSYTPGGVAAAAPTGPTYPSGTVVTLTATPDPGYTFSGWFVDGVAAGAANPHVLTMDKDHNVVAAFVPVTYTLSLTATSGGSVDADPPGPRYPAGTAVTLTAVPDPGYAFAGWTVDGIAAGGDATLVLTMDKDRAVVAAFAALPPPGPPLPPPGAPVSFPDVPASHPYYEAISQLAARGIIRGYQDGRFGPNDTTLRAQMAALIARAMGWDAEDHGNRFPDRGPVDADLWRNVGTLAFYNVARGFPDGRYRPLDNVLHAQVISFITRAMVAKGYWQQETADDPALYPNVGFASGHRWDLLTYHKHAGAIPGTIPTASWGAWDRPATRGWFAQALWQAFNPAR